MVHNSNFKDNLKFIYEEMKRRDSSFRFIIISKKDLFYCKSVNPFIKILKKLQGTLSFYIVVNYHFATSEYICLNDNFLPLAFMKFKSDAKLIQLWHGVGAFKKFGLSTENDPLVRSLVSKGNQQLDYLFVSSVNNIPAYEQAMGISNEHIYATGIPVTDYYYQEQNRQKAWERVLRRYPMVSEKKIILYVPTFRKSEGENNSILEKFDADYLLGELGKEYIILVRMHPQIQPSTKKITAGYIDVTDYDDVKELYIVSDLLITDYSSAVVEYALLNKPMIFYAYDLEQYDRGFYDSYEEMVPGPIVKNIADLSKVIKKSIDSDFNEKREKFITRHYDYRDGQSTNRVVEIIMNHH